MQAGLSETNPEAGSKSEKAALETELQRQLRNASTHRCATDDTEGRGGEVAIGICKLWMVERIEELGAELKGRSFMEPGKRLHLGNCEIQVRLSRTIY
jgi:hypothetical protein